MTTKDKVLRGLAMVSLILAGETVFMPAFHLGRYFRSSLLEVFDITNLQLGQLGAIYGIFAMGSYVCGGPIADRFSARKLLALSLLATAAGSLFMATIPSFQGMRALYAYWGVTSILIFWAPLIRATREWGGRAVQGTAFGVLDAGRGLASAVIANLAAFAFAFMVGGSVELDPDVERSAIIKLIYSYAVYCTLAAVMVWFFVPDTEVQKTNDSQKGLWSRLAMVLSSPAIWLQAVVIIAAYSAFKMLDNYGLYLESAYGLTKTESAIYMSWMSYTRVGAAFAAGWIADRRLGVRQTVMSCFLVLVFGHGLFLVVSPHAGLKWVAIANMAITCIGFFALRGVYFALLEESGTPRALTGTAVGVISFVGFTPEIYMGPLTGYWIDHATAAGNPVDGFMSIFWFLLALSCVGVAAAWALQWFKATDK